MDRREFANPNDQFGENFLFLEKTKSFLRQPEENTKPVEDYVLVRTFRCTNTTKASVQLGGHVGVG